MDESESSEEEQKRQVKILMSKISFADAPDQPKKYKYPSQAMQPFLYFYKHLALKPCNKVHRIRLVLNVPDTIIFNDKDNPLIWMYTNEHGEVCRLDNVPYQSIITKFSEGALEKQLVAVLKSPQYGYGGITGNDVKVISSGQIRNVLSTILNSRNQVNVLQRFVKASSIKASIVRTAWRRNGCNEAWVLSSNYEYTSQSKVNQINKFIVNTKMHNAFMAVKCTSEKYLKQTLFYVKNIVNFLEMYLAPMKFNELVADFIKDQSGTWWYINTKAFIQMQQPQGAPKIDYKFITMHDDQPQQRIIKKRIQSYTKCKKCRYCYKIVAAHLMTHQLTLMMILQCDQYLIRLGKDYQWLQRSYLQHIDAVNLYVQHKVCDSCYRLYNEIMKLVGLQIKLAELTGVKVAKDDRNIVSITSIPAFKGYSPQFGSRLPKVTYDTDMPTDWGLQIPQAESIKIQLNSDKMKRVRKYRLMVYVHGIRDIPMEMRGNNKKYWLRYQLFGHHVDYRLTLEDSEQDDNGMLKLSMQKIKLIYFFALGRTDIQQFIKQNPTLTINLYQDNDILGKLQLQLSDFRSDKVIKREYFKMFAGKNIFPYLSWGLFISVGLQEMDEISSAAIKLAKAYNLFIPESDYHSCDPLPQEWISMIQQKKDKVKISRVTQSEQSQSSKSSSSGLISREIAAYSKRSQNKSNLTKRWTK